MDMPCELDVHRTKGPRTCLGDATWPQAFGHTLQTCHSSWGSSNREISLRDLSFAVLVSAPPRPRLALFGHLFELHAPLPTAVSASLFSAGLVLERSSCFVLGLGWVLAAPSRAPFPSPSLREEGARFSAQRRSEMSVLDREERRAADSLQSIVDSRLSRVDRAATPRGRRRLRAEHPMRDPSKSVFLKGKSEAFSYRENRRMDLA